MGGIPKLSILIGFSLINHPFRGTPMYDHVWNPQVGMLKTHIQVTGMHKFQAMVETEKRLAEVCLQMSDNGAASPPGGLATFLESRVAGRCQEPLPKVSNNLPKTIAIFVLNVGPHPANSGAVGQRGHPRPGCCQT